MSLSNFYLCDECFTIYDGDLIKYPYCPNKECLSCGTELIELDELMLIPIRHLLSLGYRTLYCCSGHFYDSCLSTYILFDRDNMPDTYPKGWHTDGNCIRYKPVEILEWNRLTDVEKELYIFEGMTNLYYWVSSLPPNDNFEE